MRKIILAVFAILLIAGCDTKKNEMKVDRVDIKNEKTAKKITCEQKDDILSNSEDTLLIDVRTKEEYNEEHLKKAINIPYEEVVKSLEEDNVSKDTQIIVYCKSGARSSKAADSLIDAGYKNVYNLGAMSNCKN